MPSEPKLPPAGHQRDEELKKRTDVLEQKAEEIAAEKQIESLNPDAFELEREVVGRFDELDVTNRLDAYEYCWVNADNQRGYMVKQKLAKRGWEVVTGDMPESIECKGPDGTRRLADVMLMRCRKDIFKLHQERDAAHRAAVERGVTSQLEDLGRQLERKHGKVVHVNPDEMPEHMRKAVMRPGDNDVKGMRAVGAAREKFNSALHDGTVAGLKS